MIRFPAAILLVLRGSQHLLAEGMETLALHRHHAGNVLAW